MNVTVRWMNRLGPSWFTKTYTGVLGYHFEENGERLVIAFPGYLLYLFTANLAEVRVG